MNRRSIGFLVFLATLLPSLGMCSAQALTPEQRADALIARMTLAEKIQQLHGLDTREHDRWVPGIARLGIPPLSMANGPAGIGPTGFVQPHATAFPSPLAVAATWDRRDAALYGATVAEEVRAIGRTMLEAPTVNICRIPTGGRTFEAYGEDPFLTSAMAVANIQGIQSRHILANVKHFVLNNQETNRLFVDAFADERTMREIYFPPFKAAIQSAHVASIMCSYNQVNGEYACFNKSLLQDVLRDDWHFNGFIVSDFGAAHDGVRDALAGLDLEMPHGDTYNSAFEQKVRAGIVPVDRINTLLRHRYATMIRFGLFDGSPQAHPIAEQADGAIAQQLASDGIVLLRNQHSVLPLDPASTQSIAVLGPAVDQLIEGGGAASVLPLHTITPIQAVRSRFAAATLRYVPVSGVGLIDRHETIDGLALSPSPPSHQATGVTAEYFDNTTFSGQPVLVRTERIPELRSEFGAPVSTLKPQFSLRWIATLRVPASGVYTLGTEAWGAMRLYLDGKLLLTQAATPDTLKSHSVSLRLEAGRAYSLRAEYVSTGRGLARIFWSLPSGVEPPSFTRAVEAARTSDVAIVFAGTWAHEGFDAPTLALPAAQDRLIEAVAAVNPHTIVVLQSGNPVLMPWLAKVQAVLMAWFPGEEGGAAIADVLSGTNDPGGKLPVTFPASDKQVPASTPDQYPGVDGVEHYTEALEVGYRWQNAQHRTPLFPFGFGLSYTHFKFSHLTARPQPDHNVDVAVTIRNDGPRTGSEVAQLYITYPASAGEPPAQLRGFSKVALLPGASQRVHFTLTPRSFSIWSLDGHQWKVPPGKYVLAVGDSSRNLPLQQTISR